LFSYKAGKSGGTSVPGAAAEQTKVISGKRYTECADEFCYIE
jgi:hypothetical protein